MTHTRSDLERELLDLCRRFGLPTPSMNVVVAGHTVDAFWPEHGLVVEVNSDRYHGTRRARANDAKRAAELQLAGHEVYPVAESALLNEPRTVAETIAAFLAQANAGAPATTRLRPSSLAR